MTVLDRTRLINRKPGDEPDRAAPREPGQSDVASSAVSYPSAATPLLRAAGALSLSLILAFGLVPSQALAATGLSAGTIAQGPTASADANASGQNEARASEPTSELILSGENEAGRTQGLGTLSVQSASGLTSKQRTALKNRLTTAFSGVVEEIDVSDLEIASSASTTNEISSMVSDLLIGNPDFFYVDNATPSRFISLSEGTKFTGYNVDTIKVIYRYDTPQIPAMKSRYESAMATMLSWVPENASDREKVKAVHDWLVRNCNYNYDAARKGPAADATPWNAYGALVNHSPVCEGYSLAFLAAMNRLGVPCTYVTQHVGPSGHGWNRVKLGGSWFNLDVTWDDTATGDAFGDTPATTYFLKSDAWFVRNKNEQGFHSSWLPKGTPGKNSTYDNYTNRNWTAYFSYGATTKITSYKLSKESLQMRMDSTAELSLKSVSPSKVKTETAYARATWSSSNPSVVAVDARGALTTANKAGTATITCKIGGITRSCKVSVGKQSVSNASVSQISPRTYNEFAQTPRPQVTLSGTQLKEGRDYTLEYQNNINAGTAKVLIKGKGSYCGTKTVKFTISKVKVPVPTAVKNLVENGAAQTGVKGGVGYTLTGYRASAPGTYTAVASLVDRTNHVWVDGTSADKRITWSIAKAPSKTTPSSGSSGSTAGKTTSTGSTSKAPSLANPVVIKGNTISTTQAELSKKSLTFARTKLFTVTNAKGAVSYSAYKIDENAAGFVSISKNGALTLKKGMKAGLYRLMIRIDVAGDSQYKSKTFCGTIMLTVR